MKGQKNKGITLVALVITIILLLIIAGISIAVLTGDNGLFTRAKQAKQNTLDSYNTENSALDGYNDVIGSYVTGNRESEKVEKVEITDLVSDWSVTNNSVKIGNMVYIDIEFKKDSGWTVGWNNDIAKISVPSKTSRNFLTLHNWSGYNRGEISINSATSTISLFSTASRGGTGDIISVNCSYYVGE